jgi:formylglycine-generating enzyme required for sulfatase activity
VDISSIGMKLTLIPPGEFDMGSTPEEVERESAEGRQRHLDETDRWVLIRLPGELPRHRVRITRPFHLGVYLVTQHEYETVMGVNPSAFVGKATDAAMSQPPFPRQQQEERQEAAKKVAGKDTSLHPVESVNWDDAMEFCRKLSALPAEVAARRTYRLPTEAEWEYACRAGTTTRWSCGNDEERLLEHGWCIRNADEMTHPVGQKKPNAWGLYDMHGNVWQWCSDWYGVAYYRESPLSDPTGPPTESTWRVVRGGGWKYEAPTSRSAHRRFHGPSPRSHCFGFRVACEIGAKAQSARAAADGAFIREVAALPVE